MRRLALAVMVVAVSVMSCDKEDPAPQDLVTYTMEVDANWWFFASDPDGRLLDAKKLVYNQPVSLTTSNPPDSFSMTLVRIEQVEPPLITLTTYAGIRPGSAFAPKIFSPGPFEPPETEGKVTIEITNYPTDQALPLIVSDPYQSTTYNASGGDTPAFLMNIWKSKTPRFLLSGYDNDMQHPVYAFIDDAEPGSTVTVDFRTFAPFDQTIEIKGFDTNLSGSVLFTMFNNEADKLNGMQFSELGWDYTGASPVVKVGYLDEFNDYYMDLRIYEIDETNGKHQLIRNHKYTHNGPITQPIEVSSDNLQVNNDVMTNFAFVYSGYYHMRSHAFLISTSDTFVGWGMYSAPGGPSPIVEIPAELLSQFPQLDPATMPYVGSSFYRFEDGNTYKDYIGSIFTTSYGPDPSGYVQGFVK